MGQAHADVQLLARGREEFTDLVGHNPEYLPAQVGLRLPADEQLGDV